MSESYLERIASALIKDAGLPEPIREYRFHPVRKWRADFCWVHRKMSYDLKSDEPKITEDKWTKVILEIEGGIWLGSKGRHTNAMGYQKDLERSNEAALLGFTVIRVTKAHMISGQMISWLKRALGIENANE